MQEQCVGQNPDVDGDGIPYRTFPGTHPTKGSFFTRGTSHDEYAKYRMQQFSEDLLQDFSTINSSDSKNKFLSLCMFIYGSTEHYEALIMEFTNVWIKSEDSNYLLITSILEDIRQQN